MLYLVNNFFLIYFNLYLQFLFEIFILKLLGFINNFYLNFFFDFNIFNLKYIGL